MNDSCILCNVVKKTWFSVKDSLSKKRREVSHCLTKSANASSFYGRPEPTQIVRFFKHVNSESEAVIKLHVKKVYVAERLKNF